MSTFIDGIAQCQVVDKSGELVDLKGHDITSLDKTGTFTWEHKSETPATLVGKILEAKKIFTQKDCENDRHIYFWNIVKVPYLYVMGELLDDYTPSAKECAGQMKYSSNNTNQFPLLGFSIEGSELPGTRKGMIITRSIARKVTLTQAPCNSACIAEIYPGPQKPQIKDDFMEIFKSEANAIEMFKSEKGAKVYEEFLAKKEAEGPNVGGKPPKPPSDEYGRGKVKSGTNKAGEHVFSRGNIASYSFNPAEHKHTGEHHERASVMAQNPKLDVNKEGRAAAHDVATKTSSLVQNSSALSLKDKNRVAAQQGKQQMSMSEKLEKAQVPGSKFSPSNEIPKSPKVSASTPHFGPSHDAQKNPGAALGTTLSGKKVYAKAKVHEYPNFNSDEHKDASEIHRQASINAKTAPEKSFHWDKMKLHTQAAHTAGLKENRVKTALSGKKSKALAHAKMNKSLEAGSTNAAPSTLVNGAAYQSESLRKETANMGSEDHGFQGTKKKDWKKRAKQDYENWPHKDKFEKFMKARMPGLAMGEIQAIGRTIALKKSIDFEKSLSELVKKDKK